MRKKTLKEMRRKRRRRRIRYGILLALAAVILIFLAGFLLKRGGQNTGASTASGNSSSRRSGDLARAYYVSADATEDVDTSAEEDTGEESSSSYQNEWIDNVDSLDASAQYYSAGSGEKDGLGRPLGAVQLQEKYGESYPVYFVGSAEDPPTIYITFTEDYEGGYTDQILNTLQEKGAKATFFCSKSYLQSASAQVERMLSEGHEVGNAITYREGGIVSESTDQQAADIMENHNYMKDTYGYTMHLFRFPANVFSEQALAVVNNCNYEAVFFSYSYADYDVDNQPDINTSLQNALNAIHPGAIYLFQGYSSTSANMLGSFIDGALAAGYQIGLLE